MKKSTLLVAYFLVFIAMISFAFFQKNEDVKLTGNAISSLTFPSDCSEEGIQTLWNSIFVESSAGTNYFDNSNKTFCGYFKNVSDELYFIYFSNDTHIGVQQIYGLHAKIDPSYRWLIGTITNETNFLGAIFYLGLTPNSTLDRNITSTSNASLTSNQIFRITGVNWNYTASTFGGSYYFLGNDNVLTGGYLEDDETLYLAKNETVDNYLKSFYSSGNIICTPNWTQVNTTCINDLKTGVFNDVKNCGTTTGRPENITYSCDSDGNGIIGNASSVSTGNINATTLKVYINGSLMNLSKNYTSTKKVELKDGATTLINFDWNFANPLNLEGIVLRKQPSSSAFGYIIINGLDVNKTIYVDKKISNSSILCIKNSSVQNIGSFSDYCDANDELLLECPDTSGEINCLIEIGQFKVSGLMHSAVKEIAPCASNWTCSKWSSCINSSQRRTCTDNSDCIISSAKPALTQKCTITFAGNNTNSDSSDSLVATSNNSPSSSLPSTSNKKISTSVIVYILLGIIVVFAIIVALIVLIKNRNNSKPNIDDQLKPYLDKSSKQPPALPPVQPQTPQIIQPKLPPVQPKPSVTVPPVRPNKPSYFPPRPLVVPKNPANNFPPRDPRTGLPLK